jgi:membrane protein YqaA with SNARE-associated domain
MDWLLFFSALTSSTLLPGSSEALLLLRLSEGGEPWGLLTTATAGNLLGSLITFAIGRAGHRLLSSRWLRIGDNEIRRAEKWFARWGRPALLLAWLPLVGDPLCLVAGILRVSPLAFVVLVGVGKLLRYAFLVLLAV